MLIINNININVKEMEEGRVAVLRHVLKRLRISEDGLKSFRILRESTDARKKPEIFINLSVLAEVHDEKTVLKRAGKDVRHHYEDVYEKIVPGKDKLKNRPVVVGFGPAGMFAALTLAEAGLKPLVIEMGSPVEKRTCDVESFWGGAKLNPKSNVQFGEGGAGTFSDGKLTTRIKDKRIDKVLKIFKDSGAPEDIMYKSKPHVGTDILKTAVRNIRLKILSLGAEIRFDTKMEELRIFKGRLVSFVASGEEIPAEVMILAPGHSSRDTYRMLYSKGVNLEAKSFAVGYRVEHLREETDKNQFGGITPPYLKSSEYSLSAKTSGERGVYTFCMCPGGLVVNSSSEEGQLCVNGMSYHARDLINSNSAVVSTVTPLDFGNNPLDGVIFQELSEKKAFIAGGSDFKAPVMKTKDFLNGRVTEGFGRVVPSVKPGFKEYDLNLLFSKSINDSIREALVRFGKSIKGFDTEGVFTGIETRTSAPLRIKRNENLQSVSVWGLYPSGEGAGYAGGIMSAAVDGIKCAEKIISVYGSLEKD